MHISEYIKDPYAYLKEYCQKTKQSTQALDFEIIDFITYITLADGSVKELPTEALEELDDDELFLNLKNIHQEFKIEITNAKVPFCDFKLAADKQLIKIAAVFYKSQCELNIDDDLLLYEIEQNILKKCVKSHILIGIRKDYNESKIQAIISELKMGKEKTQLNLAHGLNPRIGIMAKTIKHYESKKNTSELANERGFMHPIKENELALEFIYAVPSKDGKNLTGAFIKPEVVKENTEPPFSLSEDFKEVKNPLGVKFYANKPGFVDYSFRDKTYYIKDELKIQKAGFKETGSIDGGGIDTNVTLYIDESDILEDAVGPNVNLNVARINVSGSVAQNAVVRAGVAKIGGQTHSKCQIFANEISIATHRGYAKGDLVEVDNLEGGVIEGKKVKVNKALGGKIIAKEIEITNALGNTICEASRLVKITNNLGENTSILISAAKDLSLSARLKELESQIKSREKPLKELPLKISSKKQLIENNKENIAAINEKLREFREKSIQIPAAFTLKVKEFKALVAEFNELNEELKDLKLAQESALQALVDLQDSIFRARIECASVWSEGCKVEFELISPPKRFSWVSSAGDRAQFIKLVRDGDRCYIKKEQHDSDD